MGLGLGIFSCKRRNGQDGAGQTEGSNSFIRDEETATPWLPEPLYGGLASRLSRELFGKAAVRMGVEEDLDQYESAFEFAPAPDRYNHRYYRALWHFVGVAIFTFIKPGGDVRVLRLDVAFRCHS